MSLQLSEGKGAENVNRNVRWRISHGMIFRNTRAIALHHKSNSNS